MAHENLWKLSVFCGVWFLVVGWFFLFVALFFKAGGVPPRGAAVWVT